LGPQQLQALFPSSTRKIIDLSGTWTRTGSGGTRDVSLPLSEPVEPKTVYRRTLRIEQETLNRYTWHLEFFGVSDEVEVRVNGRFLQRYPGGMVPFTVHVPERTLTPGINTIELTVAAPAEKTNL